MHKTEGGFVKLNHPDTEKSGTYSLTFVEAKFSQRACQLVIVVHCEL